MIKGFIFDLDGTLVDDNQGWKQSLVETCRYIKEKYEPGISVGKIYDAYATNSDFLWNNYSHYLNQFKTREEKRVYVWQKTLKTINCYSNHAQAVDIAKVFSGYREDNVIAYSYAKKLLKRIKEKGIRIVICTDGEEELQRMKCCKSGLDEYISKYISAVDMGVKKPNKKVFESCVKFFEEKPEELIYIGDDYEKDILGAKNVQIHSIMVNAGDGCTLQYIEENLEKIVKGCD